MSRGIVRGIYLPTRREVVFVNEAGNVEAVEAFVKLVAGLLKMLDLVKKDFGLGDEEALSLLADVLSLLYRAPLLLPPVPYQPKEAGKTGYVFNNFDYFVVYAVARHLVKGCLDVGEACRAGFVFDVLRVLDGEVGGKELSHALELSRNILNFLRSAENYEKVVKLYEALLFTPADTRPGYNYTSLASHLTLTSLVLALKNLHSKDLPLMRLVALFHDIGKLTNPVDHVNEGARIVDRIMDEIMKDKTGAALGAESWVVEALLQLRKQVYEHHRYESLIHEADVIASASDRMRKAVSELLEETDTGRKVKECYELPGRRGFECFMERLSEDEYKALSSWLYERLLAGAKDTHEPVSVHAYVYYVDFPGIQSFIRNFPKLRDMSAASFLVDFSVSTLPFILIDQMLCRKSGARLPVEALLAGYGGHAFIVAPSLLGPEDVKREVGCISGLEVRLDVSHAPFLVQTGDGFVIPRYKHVWERISRDRLKRYYVEEFEERVYSYGKHRPCDRCGRRPALPDPTEEGEYLCELCGRVHEVSKVRGLVARAMQGYFVGGQAVDVLEGMSLDDFLKRAMQYIAGMDGEEEEKKYLAVFTFDGNNAGAIFGSSLTFSEYLDKSYLADYAVKKAYRGALESLLKQNPRYVRYVKSVLAGTVYLGGDEGLLLLPSAAAIDFAAEFLSGASRTCGFTYKSGMVVVDPTHPVQFAVEAARVLEEKAKAGGNTVGVVVSSNLVDARSLESLLGELAGYIRVKNSLDSHVDFVRKAVGEGDAASRMLRALEKALRLEPRDQLEFVLYLMREYANSQDERVKDLLHRIVSEATPVGERGERVIPVYDYYFMLKTYRVGGRIG
ncbi:hypothetical protein IG193_08695 [Infirmifilum lucidum]|uniref:Cas10/Cmr2 second palm domain-containing protein n=1 Tax=Infirmifilum lucidum TaxID=2776706 RepID=A0A7L9FGQ0_9CREN|nr:hypothetical protein [Infirmifilum lucidum]QOJ78811.1 hypothetical protein IG193_08695 [Infirmifilum lucidum]